MSKLDDKLECKAKEILRTLTNYIDECKSPYTKAILCFVLGIVPVFLILLLCFIACKMAYYILHLMLAFVIIKGIYSFGTIIYELGKDNEKDNKQDGEQD